MPKGGFLSEMLASKNAHSDVSFLWRYLYYMYIGIPLLVIYFLLYQAVCVMVVGSVQSLLGLSVPHGFSDISLLHLLALAAVNLGFIVALYHFKILPYLFVPVKMVISV